MWAGGGGCPPKGKHVGGLPGPRGYLGVHPDACHRKCACAHVGLRVHVRVCAYMHAIGTQTCMYTRVWVGAHLLPFAPSRPECLGGGWAMRPPVLLPPREGIPMGVSPAPPQPIPLVKQSQGPHASQAPELHHPPQLRGVPMHCSPTRDPQLLGGGCRGRSPAPGKGHQGCGLPLGEGNRAWAPPWGEGDQA